MNPTQSQSLHRPVCRNLRSKEMFHQEPATSEDAFSSGIYWCAKTQESFGPDGQCAGKTECCADRPCYLS